MSEQKLNSLQEELVTRLLCDPGLAQEVISTGETEILKDLRTIVVRELLAVNAGAAQESGATTPPGEPGTRRGLDPKEVLEDLARGEHAWPYAGDDYPREGCTITLTVQPDGLVHMKVYEPTWTPLGRYIESYRDMRPEAVATAVTDWLSGRKPRLDGPYL